MDIIVLTVDRLQKAITEIKKEVEATEQQLRETLNNEEFLKLKENLDAQLTTLRKDIEERKRKKFLRDTEDYLAKRVYRWRDTSGYAQRGPSSQGRGGYSSSSSGSEFQVRRDRRPPFFQRRRGRQGGHHHRRTNRTGDNEVTGITETLTSENIVINISSKCLSSLEIGVLQKGLSFCSTDKLDTFQLDIDLERFFRMIRLKAHFSTDRPQQDSSARFEESVPSPGILKLEDFNLKQKSHFMPPKYYHPVETYCNLVKTDIDNLVKEIKKGDHRVRGNISVLERRALSDLAADRTITIKPGDKGGSIVIMDTTSYKKEVMRQLSDTDTYLPLENNPLGKIQKKIKSMVERHRDLGID
ncbi:uncharacterized protein LOC130297282 [Hyla sarda]|uniref:uncharacterized protein LOC130297282 n=1 Tax=Hyla sarda TaxID=327740 RepID=UPI0024C3FB7C|nr:uncharacterized protein LOC130297282 [Hyla sarda]